MKNIRQKRRQPAERHKGNTEKKGLFDVLVHTSAQNERMWHDGWVGGFWVARRRITRLAGVGRGVASAKFGNILGRYNPWR